MYASTFGRSPLLNASSQARRVLPAGVSGVVVCAYPINANTNAGMHNAIFTPLRGGPCLAFFARRGDFRAGDESDCRPRIVASRCINGTLLIGRSFERGRHIGGDRRYLQMTPCQSSRFPVVHKQPLHILPRSGDVSLPNGRPVQVGHEKTLNPRVPARHNQRTRAMIER